MNTRFSITWLSMGSAVSSPSDLPRLSSRKLCSTALAGPTENKRWETTVQSKPYVNEAKKRSFTVADCMRHAGMVVPTPSAPTDTGTIEQRLTKLKKLHDSGLIDEDAYKKKMDALLEQLWNDWVAPNETHHTRGDGSHVTQKVTERVQTRPYQLG